MNINRCDEATLARLFKIQFQYKYQTTDKINY